MEETIGRIRAGMKAATGRAWSVKRGRGTAGAWLDVEAPPKRRVCGRFGEPAGADEAQTFAFAAKMRPFQANREDAVRSYLEDKARGGREATGGTCLDDAEALGRVFRARTPETHVSIPPGRGCWSRYVALAEGREPQTECERDWD